MRDYFSGSEKISFVDFIDGDCVDTGDGVMKGGVLVIPIRVSTEPNCEVYVNSVRATEAEKGIYTAPVEIIGYRNSVVAENKTLKAYTRIAIFNFISGEDRFFRLSSDDNILFLKDLTENNYSSIFENPYLAVYKKAHDLYGAKIHLNLFYSLDEESLAKLLGPTEYFDLSMMTDRYKDEFELNSDWLKLAFHSASGYPPRPYSDSNTETITRDCIKVCREIIRFAGEKSLSNSTTIHYGSASLEGVRALRALGLRSLTGYFIIGDDGKPKVSYYADEKLARHVGSRDFWVDTSEDMIFGRIDCVLNWGSLEELKQSVKEAVSDIHRSSFISVMIHEQYFYRNYVRYLSDFEERVLWTCKYLHDNGYVGMHISDITRERALSAFPALK